MDGNRSHSAAGRRWAAELCLAETEESAVDVLSKALLDFGFEQVSAVHSKAGVSNLWSRLGGETFTDDHAFAVAREEITRNLHPSPERWAANYRKVFSLSHLFTHLGPCVNDVLQLPRDFGNDALQTMVSAPCPGRPNLMRLGVGSSAPTELLRDRFGDVHFLIRLYGALGAEDVTTASSASERFPDLTPRQLECLRWAAAGKTYEDIADIMGLSERGVRFHLNKAREALGFATITQTIVHAAKVYDIDPLDGW